MTTPVCEPCKEACAAFVDADARVHRKGARDADDDDDAETSEAVAMGLEKLAKRIRALPSQPTGDVRPLNNGEFALDCPQGHASAGDACGRVGNDRFVCMPRLDAARAYFAAALEADRRNRP